MVTDETADEYEARLIRETGGVVALAAECNRLREELASLRAEHAVMSSQWDAMDRYFAKRMSWDDLHELGLDFLIPNGGR
jgi:ribosomal protein L29